MSEMNAQTVAEITEKLRLASENTTRMYNVGFEAGRELGDEVFWDSIQAYGTRTDYEYLFRDTRWDRPFNPKYSFGNVLRAHNVFKNTKVGDNLYTDKLDFSKCVNMDGAFNGSDVTRLKRIDLRGCSPAYNGANTVFLGCSSLKEITEFYPPTNTNPTMAFDYCDSLETLNVCSEIAVNGFDFRRATKLSKASIKSIIGALSIGTSGLSITLSRAAVNKAFETSEGANDGENSNEWTDDIIDANYNWNIVLA